MRAFTCIAAALLVAGAVHARTYDVGPAMPYSAVSEVAAELKPGDVVEIHGEIHDAFTIAAHGMYDDPIVIRGAPTGDNPAERARILLDEDMRREGVTISGNWVRLENLGISGARGRPGSDAAVSIRGEHVTVRNCRIHNNLQGLGCSGLVDDILIEFCEFDSNGGAAGHRHSAFLISEKPGARVTVQHCWFHDATGGNFIKTRCPRVVIRYNWFESTSASCVSVVDFLQYGRDERFDPLYPLHTDIVGNVFFQGWSPGRRYATLRIGGEEQAACGTEGDFHIAHNLFVTTRRAREMVPEDETVHMSVRGNVDNLRLYNNIFLEYGATGAAVYSRGAGGTASRLSRGRTTGSASRPSAFRRVSSTRFAG